MALIEMNLDFILEIDKETFIYLNSLGSSTFDNFWLLISDKKSSIPLYIFLIYFLKKNLNSKHFINSIIFIGLLILFTDQISGFFKDYYERLRPCHDQLIISKIRIVKESCGGLYSFFSSHASNSFALASFFYFLMSKKNRYIKLLFVWALIVSYSRIYIGVHFPLDIICGTFFGLFSGYLFSWVLNKKYNVIPV